LLLIRKIHAYVGLLIAPSLLFFAFSGLLQIFSLHQAHGSYHPPAIFQALGNVHKDQVLTKAGGHRGPPLSAAAATSDHDHSAPAPHADAQQPKIKTYVLKWFFALVAVGLFLSTLLGVWMGLRFTRRPRLSWSLLIAGAALPVLILLL
jgi:hypothetical protein